MGIDSNGIRFLARASERGVSFERTVTLGRQTLNLSKSQLAQTLKLSELEFSRQELDDFFAEDRRADRLIRFLEKMGATSVRSLDASDYEGADLLHDLNTPIPEDMAEQATMLIDGGTLEHIFDTRVALENCFKLIEVGGHYVGLSPANNFCGHGFYQFSPEFYFQVFPHYGFEIIDIISCLDRPGAKWYHLCDPNQVQDRVEITNCHRTFLLVLARKTKAFETPRHLPQQSDYQDIMWKGNPLVSQMGTSQNVSLRGVLARMLPRWLKQIFRKVERGSIHMRKQLAIHNKDLGSLRDDYFRKVE